MHRKQAVAALGAAAKPRWLPRTARPHRVSPSRKSLRFTAGKLVEMAPQELLLLVEDNLHQDRLFHCRILLPSPENITQIRLPTHSEKDAYRVWISSPHVAAARVGMLNCVRCSNSRTKHGPSASESSASTSLPFGVLARGPSQARVR